ncbi:TonB-dependent receptor [Nitrospirillum sp. BR 11164]|uniref:TonB-dependent receptor n=1 Tax=Nitrospirillum sp. BR 11164 TaxID=3104324 RepID=UPI002AFF3014|nr:TonB-dependent receptor [Nitrospirillum sp. BR 11164]MEA1650521.1 TonB-dependent receptor [Nitrospirillum sp. BR 11164]
MRRLLLLSTILAGSPVLSASAALAADVSSSYTADHTTGRHTDDPHTTGGQTPASVGPAADSDSPLDQIIVTATRRAEALRDVPASVSTVSRDEFEQKGVLFIGDELTDLPGVLVSKNDMGTYTSITLRGVPAKVHNDTLVVMMDGIPYVTGDDEVDLEQLPYSAVGRVDVVRGPMSALYGRGAISGTINYLTREVTDETKGEVTLQAGSDGWLHGDALLQTPTVKGGALLLDVGHERGDGWRDRTGRNETNLFLKHQLDMGDAGRLTVTATWVDTRQQLAGELPVDGRGELINLPGGREANWNEDNAGFYKRMATATATYERDLADGLVATTKLHVRQALTSALQGFANEYDPSAGSVTFTGFRVDGNTITGYGEQQLSWTHGPWQVLGGVSAEQVRAHHTEHWTGQLDDTYYYGEQRSILTGQDIDTDQWVTDTQLNAYGRERAYAAYLQVDRTVGPVTLDVGGRYDYFERHVVYGDTTSGGPNGAITPGGTAYDDNAHFSPKASVTWKVTPGVSAYVAYGQGFSAAFGPLWSFRTRQTGLNPELADNVEAGVKGDAFGGLLSGSVTVYRLQRHDLLQVVEVNGVPQTFNTGEQLSQGVELAGSARLDSLVPHLSADVTYGYTEAYWLDDRFVESDTLIQRDFTGKRVQGVPRHTGSIALNQGIPTWGLSGKLWVEMFGDYAYDSQNSRVSGGYALWNTTWTWTPPHQDTVDLSLTVRNLFDRKVNLIEADDNGPLGAFPQPPRQILGTVKVRF